MSEKKKKKKEKSANALQDKPLKESKGDLTFGAALDKIIKAGKKKREQKLR